MYSIRIESWKVDPKRYGIDSDLAQVVHMKFVIRDSLGRIHGATNFRMK